jgi:Ca2+/H+ antiporter, TMEM165/GDT1 family
VAFLLTMAAAAAAVGIEMLEALAIVLAVGMARGFRDALLGALAAAVAVVLICLALGPALLADADLHFLRVLIGSLLLLFGLEWLRKGVLRMAGQRRRSSSYDEFVEEREELAALPGTGGPDWAARLVAFKGVFLEGLEVGLIVLALGGTPGRLTPALLGTAVAVVLVIGIGVVLHEPLRRLPETQLKLGVGVALTAFGTFFTAEGLRVEWPLGDAALLYLAAGLAGVAWLATRRLGRTETPALEAAA